MKYDFCVGNPPYQEETAIKETTNGQKRRKSIFQYFQYAADAITKQCSVLIYPAARWIHRSGKGMQDFGMEQINSPHLSKLIVYPNATDVFTTTEIGDGISIVVKKNQKETNEFNYIYKSKESDVEVVLESPGTDLIPLDPRDLGVIAKVKNFVKKHKITYLHDSILSQKLFGIESDFVEKNPNKVTCCEKDTVINSQDKVKILTNDKAGSAGRAKWFIVDRKDIPQRQEYIDEYQVAVSSANAAGKKRDNQIEIIDNHSAFGRARVGLKSFKTLNEAKNFFKYANTYLVRFMFLISGDALTSLAVLVPDFMDYTSKNKFLSFDEDLDEQLFKLFGLNKQEQEYVKEVIDNLRKKQGR